MSRPWLITGAQGLLGRYAAAHILSIDPEATVVGLGRSSPVEGFFSHSVTGRDGLVRAPLPLGMNTPLISRFTYLQADVCDSVAMARIVKMTCPAVVLHFASGLRGDQHRELLLVNSKGTEAVLTACSKTIDPPVFVLASSGGVYGHVSSEEGLASENRLCSPSDDYAQAKLRAEEVAQRVAGQTGPRLIILRIFNVIAAGQDERHIGGKLALQITRIRAARQEQIMLGSLEPIRDFIDARDVAAAAVGLARNATACGVFNCGSGRPTSIRKLCSTFLEASGLELPVVSDTSAPTGVLRNCGNLQRLSAYDLAPTTSLLESAKSCFAYYQQVWS